MTKEDAERYINKYENKLRSKVIKEKKCICCKNSYITIGSSIYPDPMKQEEGMWDNGIICRGSAGYGSKHDMMEFIFAVCDNCVQSLWEEGDMEYTQKIAKDYHSEELSKTVEREIKIDDLLNS
jgi:hypothetical protein